MNDERLAILKMLESGQLSAEQAEGLLDGIEQTLETETSLAASTVEEEAWMLTALLQVTDAIASPAAAQQDAFEMLERVVRIVPLVAGVDRCAMFLRAASSGICLPAAWYPAGAPAGPLDVSSLVEDLEDGAPIITDGGPDSAHACLPMLAQGDLMGVMQVEYVNRPHVFSIKETAILANIARQAAVGLENQRLRREAVEMARLEREMQLARTVQSSLLPAGPPHLTGWDIAGHWQAARAVGGDFYDFIPLGRGQMGLAIADVSDKGMSAALFMALSRSILRGSVTCGGNIGRALERANCLICADAHDGMFVTLLYAVLGRDAGDVRFCNAGHNAAILATGQGTTMLSEHGLALGINVKAPHSESRITLAAGDVLVLYTDGISEAMNEVGEQFGAGRLAATVAANRSLGAGQIIEQLNGAVSAFTGGRPPADDATVVVAKYIGIGMDMGMGTRMTSGDQRR